MIKMNSRLLQVRKELKRKKPYFIRQDSHKKVEVKQKWRKPKGHHSKMRHGFRGYRRSVEVGWGSPKEVYGLHPSGLNQITIGNVSELNKIDSSKDGALISAAVG